MTVPRSFVTRRKDGQCGQACEYQDDADTDLSRTHCAIVTGGWPAESQMVSREHRGASRVMLFPAGDRTWVRYSTCLLSHTVPAAVPDLEIDDYGPIRWSTAG